MSTHIAIDRDSNGNVTLSLSGNPMRILDLLSTAAAKTIGRTPELNKDSVGAVTTLAVTVLAKLEDENE